MRMLASFLLAALFTAAASGQELRPWTGGATPALALADVEGRTHRLESYRGKVVLVNFWATWCEPCRDEMPSIGRLRESLAGRAFVVLAVNLAEPESRVRGFMAGVPMNFPVLLDRDSAVARAWGARILPATYLVGPDGKIRFFHRGELDWSGEPVRRQVAALLPR